MKNKKQEDFKIKKKKFRDCTLLYLYSLKLKDDVLNLDDNNEYNLVIFNKINDNILNDFLLKYISKKKEFNPELDYDTLSLFDDFDYEILESIMKSMLPDNLILTKFVDKDMISSLSKKYKIPKIALLEYVNGKED